MYPTSHQKCTRGPTTRGGLASKERPAARSELAGREHQEYHYWCVQCPSIVIDNGSISREISQRDMVRDSTLDGWLYYGTR